MHASVINPGSSALKQVSERMVAIGLRTFTAIRQLTQLEVCVPQQAQACAPPHTPARWFPRVYTIQEPPHVSNLFRAPPFDPTARLDARRHYAARHKCQQQSRFEAGASCSMVLAAVTCRAAG